MAALAWLIDTVIDIFVWLLIASAILSWLVAFDIVNRRNRVVYLIGDFLYRVTDPPLRPLRRIIPSIGGIDVTPVILILILVFLRNLLLVDILPRLM